jgi:hypothetical protein
LEFVWFIGGTGEAVKAVSGEEPHDGGGDCVASLREKIKFKRAGDEDEEK